MIIKLVEIFENSGSSNRAHTSYSLREVFINPDHVVCLREDLSMKRKREADFLPEDMNPSQQYTKVSLNRGHSGIDLVVVGPPTAIEGKLRSRILKG